jgi:hypothetical protein
MDTKKLAIRVFGLVAAIGIPAGLYKGYHFWQGSSKASDTPPAASVAGSGVESKDATSSLSPNGRPAGPAHRPRSVNLAEVLNFNVTPDWIMQRWPRVSTGLAQLQLQGYRVPLVTGIAQDDLAGSLTYYFNPNQQVQRITFLGNTGDWRKLASVLSAEHHLRRRLTNDPSLMVFESVHPNGKLASTCTIRTAPVVAASDAYHRFQVDLALERPRG